MKSLLILLLAYMIIINLVSFFAMLIDKRRAKLGRWRISQRTLLLLSFFGGSLGGILGMVLCRHKTKHRLFTVLNPLFFTLHTALLFALYFILLKEGTPL